jgi:Kelch motif/Secretion system C-terminal sorting domain
LEDWHLVSNKNEVYDPQTNTWEEKSPIPLPKHNYSAAVFNDKIYIFGGDTQSGSDVWSPSASVEVYDPATDVWETISPMPVLRFNAGISVIENKILLMGGFEDGQILNRVDVFDPVENSWSIGSTLPLENAAMGSTVFNNKVYIVGGSKGPAANWNYYTNVYEGTISIPTHIKTSNTQPLEFNVAQNYPNPFNPTTTINFSIPEIQFVTLKVYDLLGKEIITLISGEKSPGNYEVDFNGSNLKSGTYFYRLQCGEHFETKKLVLLK